MAPPAILFMDQMYGFFVVVFVDIDGELTGEAAADGITSSASAGNGIISAELCVMLNSIAEQDVLDPGIVFWAEGNIDLFSVKNRNHCIATSSVTILPGITDSVNNTLETLLTNWNI